MYDYHIFRKELEKLKQDSFHTAYCQILDKKVSLYEKLINDMFIIKKDYCIEYSTAITERPELIFYKGKDSFLYDLFKYELMSKHKCEMILKYKGHFFIGA